MNSPIVTAIIPAFNAEKTLLRAVTSILNQTCEDFELIIVDDGSVDNTLQLAQAIDDERVSTIAQTNQGPGAARNAGLSVARGQWVAFLDSDDEWESDFFADALNALSLHPTLLFYFGSSMLITAKERTSNQSVEHTPYLFTANKNATEKKLRSELELSMCFMLADKKTVQALGGYYDKNKCTYGEDSILSVLIFWQYPVVKTNKIVHTYHRVQTGLSASRHNHVQIRPLVSDSDYLLSRLPQESHDKMRDFIAYNASIDAYRLAKVGRVAAGYKLIIEKQIMRNAFHPGVWRSLIRFAIFAVVSVFKRRR